jgi:nucleotide-binding universal stress UspA family protein
MIYKRILVPVDGSAVSAKGLKEAIRIAKAGRAKLVLLHLIEEFAAFAAPELGENIGPVLDSLRQTGKRTIDKVARSVKQAGVTPQSVLVENFGGRVADTIVKEAKRLRADLIVMGTHGRSGVTRVLLGSDAELVVRNSPVPVLLVPAGAKRKSA